MSDLISTRRQSSRVKKNGLNGARKRQDKALPSDTQVIKPVSIDKFPERTEIRALTRKFGLTDSELESCLKILGRDPDETELGIFSSMWSEHCSYKSSKVWLKTLPTTGPRVICGPGETAGVVDIGDGEAV